MTPLTALPDDYWALVKMLSVLFPSNIDEKRRLLQVTLSDFELRWEIPENQWELFAGVHPYYSDPFDNSYSTPADRAEALLHLVKQGEYANAIEEWRAYIPQVIIAKNTLSAIHGVAKGGEDENQDLAFIEDKADSAITALQYPQGFIVRHWRRVKMAVNVVRAWRAHALAKSETKFKTNEMLMEALENLAQAYQDIT